MNKKPSDSLRDLMIVAIGTAGVLLASVLLEDLKISEDQLQCRDENNQPVDWFVIYKIPKLESSISHKHDPLINDGVSYLYITSETVAEGWTLSRKGVDSQTSIPGNTLASLYKNEVPSDLMWIVYNDQYKENTNCTSKYGHAKGVFMANRKQGFWLIHSVPEFPLVHGKNTPSSSEMGENNYNQKSVYPESGKPNGQSFMCISVNAKEIEKIARQLIINQIYVYNKNVPTELGALYPTFENASDNKRSQKNEQLQNKDTINSLGGSIFTSFAKNKKFKGDLYDNFVGKHLNSDLLVQTWSRPERAPAEVEDDESGVKWWIVNVKSIYLERFRLKFESTHDHSKWVVSRNGGPGESNGNWVCVGDLNRGDLFVRQISLRSQGAQRGGGTVCLQSSALWEPYRKQSRLVSKDETTITLYRKPEKEKKKQEKKKKTIKNSAPSAE